MYKPSDIHIFLFTFNRAAMLREALESLRAQTLQGFRLTVLDNSSKDNTQEVVESFKDIGAEYFKTPGDLPRANLIHSQKLADTPYTLIFHDDDLMHPQYMENILKALNSFKNVSMVSSAFTYFYNDDIPASLKEDLNVNQCYFFKNYKEYALSFWTEAFGCWSGSCDKTENFKKVPVMFEEYGKLHDGPIMIESAKKGAAVVLAEPKLFYTRKHKGRDSFNDNGILPEQFLNWFGLFYGCAGGGDKNNPLWYLYANKVEGVLKIQYETFLSSKTRKQIPYAKMLELLKERGYLSNDMQLFAARHKNVLNRIKNLKFAFKKQIRSVSVFLIPF